jgi:hypothetical protein
MKRFFPLIGMACSACMFAPYEPDASARTSSRAAAETQAVCVVPTDGTEAAPDCPQQKEAPPESDEPCVEIVPSDSLNHGPPKVHAFCSPDESAHKARQATRTVPPR